MLTLQRRTWPRLYVDCLRATMREGYARPSRHGETIELGPAFVSCPAPLFMEMPGRGGSSEFARIEQLGYLAGVGPEDLLRVAPNYGIYAEADGTYPWAYGPRLASQLHDIVAELSRRPFSRCAIATIWTRADLFNAAKIEPPKVVPCALSLSFWTGPAGEIRMHAHVRSQDLYLGFYYDLPAFAFLQRIIAKALKRGTGYSFLSAVSFHVYLKNSKKIPDIQPKMRPGSVLVHASIPEPPDGWDARARLQWLVDWAQGELNNG